MSLPEDQFDIEKSLEKFRNSNSQEAFANPPKVTSVENYEVHKKQIEGLFKKLLIGGLIGGIILASIVVVLLKKLGLADKPQPQRVAPEPTTEQIRFLPNTK